MNNQEIDDILSVLKTFRKYINNPEKTKHTDKIMKLIERINDFFIYHDK